MANDNLTPSMYSLPELKVLQETYCSQKMTDDIFFRLQKEAPNLMNKLIDAVRENEVLEYRSNLNDVVVFLRSPNSQLLKTPITRLGMLDLIFELERRLMKMFERPEPILRGHPIASGPDQPLLSMPDLMVDEAHFDFGRIDQEVADKALRLTYENRPDIVFEISEHIRRDSSTQEIWRNFVLFIDDFVSRQLNIPITTGLTHCLRRELKRRILVMCDIEME